MLFTVVATGFPGRIHDSGTLRHTALYDKVNHFEILREPKININGYETGPFMVGDGGYPLSKWLIKPCHFSPVLIVHEKKFNKCLSLSRSAVE